MVHGALRSGSGTTKCSHKARRWPDPGEFPNRTGRSRRQDVNRKGFRIASSECFRDQSENRPTRTQRFGSHGGLPPERETGARSRDGPISAVAWDSADSAHVRQQLRSDPGTPHPHRTTLRLVDTTRNDAQILKSGQPGCGGAVSWIAPRSNALRSGVGEEGSEKKRKKTENPLDRGAIHDSGRRAHCEAVMFSSRSSCPRFSSGQRQEKNLWTG